MSDNVNNGSFLFLVPCIRYGHGDIYMVMMTSTLSNDMGSYEWNINLCLYFRSRSYFSSRMSESETSDEGVLNILLRNQNNNKGQKMYEDMDIDATVISLVLAGK